PDSPNAPKWELVTKFPVSRVDGAIGGVGTVIVDISERREQQTQNEQRQQVIEHHIASFDSSVQSMLETLGGSASEMRATATGMATRAERASRQVAAVASASEQAASNVQYVAGATKQMAATVAEISRQVTQSSEIAGTAVDEAERTNKTMQALD